MTLTQSLLVSLFLITVVFAVLAALFCMIRVFSVAASTFSAKKLKLAASSAPISEPLIVKAVSQQESDLFSTGALKLTDVNEPTAAMIMAIVSDESGISLNELCFKSIRLIKK